VTTEAGAFVAVVGPSGAGKDTLIDLARSELAGDGRYVFVRRVVTRPALREAEDHDSLGVEAFLAAEAAGQFSVSWRAHGLHYGVPATAAQAYGRGAVIVSNVSRAALGDIAARFARLHIVEVTAPHEVLVARLAARGRESRDEIEARLGRAVALSPPAGATLAQIDNSARPQDAAGRLVAAIRAAAVRKR
jgi:ribose 1,5-bisphosphokinase